MKTPKFIPLALLCSSSLLAQTTSISAPSIPNITPVNFGASMAIVSDKDGNREVVVGAPGNGGTSPSGMFYHLDASTGAPIPGPTPVLNTAQLGISTTGLQLGHSAVNVGDVAWDASEEFAVSIPNFSVNEGRVAVFSVTENSFSGVRQRRLLGYLSGPQSFGESLAMVNTPTGPQLAVGAPAVNQVRTFDIAALAASGVMPPNPSPTRILTDPTFNTPFNVPGRLGTSICAGPATDQNGNPSYFMAAGAPNYQPTFTGSPLGYIAVFDLSGGSTPVARLSPATSNQRLGRAVVSVGFLPNTASPRPDFAALAGNGQILMFDTPNAVNITANVAAIATGLVNPTSGSSLDGRMVSAGDFDSNGLGDFVVSSGGRLRIISTQSNSLNPLTVGTGASSFCGLASGTDLFGTGAIDVLAGPNSFGPDTVRVLPFASTEILPNATEMNLAPTSFSRPILSNPSAPSTFNLTATKTTGGVEVVALFGDLAPAVPLPVPVPLFSGGMSYLGPQPVALGAGVISPSAPFSWQLPMPNTGALQGLVFQAVLAPATGPLVVSDGVLARVGAF